MQNLVFIFIVFFSFFTNSQDLKSQKQTQASEIYKVLNHYQKKDSIVMEIDKKFSQPFLKKETQSKGKFYFSKSLWRLELFSTQKTQIIYDGKHIIYKLGNNVSHYTPSSQYNILPSLFNQKVFTQTFKYQERTQKGRTYIYSFSGTPPSPPKISIQIEKDRILSLLIQLEEPLGEEYYRFSSIQFNQNLSKKLFQEP